MRSILMVLVLLLVSAGSFAQKPTTENITAAMKRMWEQEKGPRKTVDINSIKIGGSETANLKHEVEGIPKGSLVTHAEIDWTHNSIYTDKTQSTRRISSTWVFKDATGNWRVKTHKSATVN